mgnify:CR=1 FL=1
MARFIGNHWYDFSSEILVDSSTTNLHPVWSEDATKFAYLSNQNKDYFGQTDLYVYDLIDSASTKLVDGVSSAPVWLNDSTIIFSKKSEPNENGSKYYDLYLYQLGQKKKKPKRRLRTRLILLEKKKKLLSVSMTSLIAW